MLEKNKTKQKNTTLSTQHPAEISFRKKNEKSRDSQARLHEKDCQSRFKNMAQLYGISLQRNDIGRLKVKRMVEAMSCQL